jgi:hypothetical protein
MLVSYVEVLLKVNVSAFLTHLHPLLKRSGEAVPPPTPPYAFIF